MAFDGTEGSSILKGIAGTWTENWRDDEPNYPKGFFFGRNHIETILNQSGCKGIRIYMAKDGEGDMTLILVGVNSSENDQLGIGDMVLDGGVPCPSNCGDENTLNS